MYAKELPSQNELRELFDYEIETGYLIHKSKRHNGKPAGTNHHTGYRRIKINGEQYFAHRVIWKMVYGEIPTDKVIDHIDGDGLNNKLDNLRLCDQSSNTVNRRADNHRSLPKGIYPARRKFKAQIQVDGKLKYLGVFETIEEAKVVYDQAAKAVHGDFFRE